MTTKLLLHFDGNISDSSELNVGTTQFGTLSYQSGKFSQGITGFSESNYIKGPSLGDIGAGDFTFEGFIQPVSSGYKTIFSHVGASFDFSGHNYDMWFTVGKYNGQDVFLIRYGADFTAKTSKPCVLIAGGFNHFALVRQSGSLKLFINGSMINWDDGSDAGLQSIPFVTSFSSNYFLMIGGGDQSGYTYPYPNILDEFRVSDVPLYSANFTTPSAAFTTSSSNNGGSQQQGVSMSNQIKKKYLGENSVDGSKIKLLAGQFLKAVDSTGSEIELLKVGSDNKVLIKGSEVGLKSQVTAEESRAMSEEARIEGKVNSEKSRAEGVEAGHNTRLLALEADPVTKTYVDGEVSDLQSQIDNISSNIDPAALDSLTEVVAAFQAADSNLNSAIQALGTGSTSALSAEISRAEGEEARIEGKIDQEILDRASDTSAKLVEAKSYADTKKSEALSYADTKKSEAQAYADAAVLVEKTRAQSAESTLTSSISTEQSRAQAEEALMFKKDGSRSATGSFNMGGFGIGNLPTSGFPTLNGHVSTKKYVDDQVSAEASARSSAVSGVQSSLTSEISRAQAAEAQALVDAKAYADVKKSEAQSYADAAVLVEKNRAEASEGVLTSSINTEKGRIDAILLASDADKNSFAEIVSLINMVDTSNDTAFASYVLSNDAALASEISRAQGAESEIASDLASEISRAQAAEAQVLADAATYGDTKRAQLKAYSDSTFETKASHNSDKAAMEATFATEKTLRESEEARIEGKVDSEISRAQSAESALSVRVTSLEALQDGPEFHKESFTVGSNGVGTSSISLGHEAMANSIVVFVGRLGAHEGIDYSVAVSGGVSVITWMGSMASGGAEEISSGDNIYVTFAKMI